MADNTASSTSKVETARLSLDPPSAVDDAAMGAMLSDPATMVHLQYMAKSWQGGWKPEELVARRENHIKTMNDKRGSTFYIHNKSTGELAGVMGANMINMKDRNATVGIILSKKYWSGGYGIEALFELMRGLFEDLKLHKLLYETTEANVGMRKFLEETCGVPMAYIRKEEVWCQATEKWLSLWQYELFEDDWPRIRAILLENMKRGAAKHATTA
ncbi:acyl-CoA N-acyltransferase [Gamsiella multidivaricata]|uniref:acyl-CoA N-acyltransferase n=1 Tax=Gamsiella multidivaricata TaxID=101098 RepID=UPI00221FAD47|nr:acyl-CoA N-acyltransferase [Gamsiella multidivaricata]KAG0370828.1 hypothetical protein BGZ54_003550 [Gamsiella multidivaricata]KAI7817601.1 acyl-CoA N-acyltransferase [Gamsiella multidivaricata]